MILYTMIVLFKNAKVSTVSTDIGICVEREPNHCGYWWNTVESDEAIREATVLAEGVHDESLAAL